MGERKQITNFEMKITRKNGKPRGSIQDTCDFCGKYAYFRRWTIKLRTKGWKLACSKCFRDQGFEFGKDNVVCSIKVNGNAINDSRELI